MKQVTLGSTEGDVETQVVLPLLTSTDFLSIPSEHVRSKNRIAPRNIGKGAKAKIGYIPDFCIYKYALPIVVVEAKSPSIDVETAYSEAQLYSSEINRSFQSGCNPCSRVIATNGIEILAGYWDSGPSVRSLVSDMVVGSAIHDQLVALVGNEKLEHLGAQISQLVRAGIFIRPFNRGGGETQINSSIDPNTFAADLSPALRRYFTSRDQTTDQEIYSRAYISSNEVTSYDRILESFLRDRLNRSSRKTEITTSRRKSEAITDAINQFDERKTFGGDLQLVTGGVGAGKSLFARRYKEYLQPEPLRARNHWAFINFINPPEDFSRWNDWVCEGFVNSVIAEGAPIDLRQEEDQERIFATDLADRAAFYRRMENIQIGKGALEKARDIEAWRQNTLKLTRGISRYLQGDKGENLIVVFDNVDRREAAGQLAAFQTALWFMDQTKCLVILQMRDSTFEAYKNEPPLDTYRTGQIFYISPPRFIDVVKKRLELSLEYLANQTPEQINFKTRSGVSVIYPNSRAGEFLSGIYHELFVSKSNVSRVLEALAGRNVRRALDMFFAIITSGHMPEELIASVAQGKGMRNFPEHLILRALMRQSYRFFNNNTGFVANIFHCEGRWKRPSNLIIPELLFYLISQRKVRGDNGQMGFLALSRLLLEMEILGFVRDDVKDAAVFCLQKELIEVDTSALDVIRDCDSIKATASGWAHMRILSARLEYAASVLPTTAIDDTQYAARIYDQMQQEMRLGRMPYNRAISLVEQFEAYLRQQANALGAHPGFSGRSQSGTQYIINKLQEAIKFARKKDSEKSPGGDLLDF
jgi:hypothetical protein